MGISLPHLTHFLKKLFGVSGRTGISARDFSQSKTTISHCLHLEAGTFCKVKMGENTISSNGKYENLCFFVSQRMPLGGITYPLSSFRSQIGHPLMEVSLENSSFSLMVIPLLTCARCECRYATIKMRALVHTCRTEIG